MARVALQDQFRDHPLVGFVDWVLRGIGQVVFQNNPISGAVILAAIFYNSWIYGIACLLLVAVLLQGRVALGAQRGEVGRMIVMQSVRLAVIGVVIGVAGALSVRVATRLVTALSKLVAMTR